MKSNKGKQVIMVKEMKKLNFNVQVLDEYDKPIGFVSILLAGPFMRVDVREEHVIKKVEIFTGYLKSGKPFELDEVDIKLFRSVVISSDAARVVKSDALRILDKAES